jgi:hypothetical protein
LRKSDYKVEMMDGVVTDVYKNYVKVKTNTGEKVLKIRGKRTPEKGWVLELRKNDPDSPFVGSVILESLDPLPPLSETIPIVESTKSIESFDVVFLTQMTKAVRARLGFLPKWYYSTLGEYYRKGEKRVEGLFSDLVSEVIGKRRVRIDRMKTFGDWLNTFSHPLYFRSYSGKSKPIRVFVKKPGILVRVDSFSKEYGRVIVEGSIGKTNAKLKVISEKTVEASKLEDLRKKLEDLLGNALVVQGGKGLGYYV